uniref:Uncharacterized protein n=1 Tax=Arundo donax TaxID=35708 RepID=A0A0A9CGR4_ARUDO
MCLRNIGVISNVVISRVCIVSIHFRVPTL